MALLPRGVDAAFFHPGKPSVLAAGAEAARTGRVPGMGLGAARASEMRSTIAAWHNRQS